MKIKKAIASVALISLFPIYSTYAALDLNQFNQIITDLQNTVSKYAQTIRDLQEENAKLKKTIDEYKIKLPGISASAGSTGTTAAAPAATKTSPVPSKASSVDKYNKLIDKINLAAQDIFSNNNLSSESQIGLFEFIEPSNFFISIDDGKNPSGEYAFKKKLLYSYDSNLNLKVDGIFEIDWNSGYYKTLSGKNPFAKATRIRVKNPDYNGKLLTSESVASPAQSSAAPAATPKPATTTTTSASVSNVTLDSVKSAYNKNKILDALKLSTEYIKADPNNIDVAKIRYRSFYILGKYNESLTEVQKIETLIGLEKMEKVVACDAKTIAKLAKNADLNKRYGDACSSKK